MEAELFIKMVQVKLQIICVKGEVRVIYKRNKHMMMYLINHFDEKSSNYNLFLLLFFQYSFNGENDVPVLSNFIGFWFGK